MTDIDGLPGWTPVFVHPAGGAPTVDWCHLGRRRFTDPFFIQTADAAAREPFNAVFRRETPLQALVDLARAAPGLPPAGFIFHVSRCGSTLVSQMLASSPRNLVISEAPPVEGILRLRRFHPDVTESDHIALIRGLISALGQPRQTESRYFVKFDPWHVLDIPLVRTAFPGVPLLLLFRRPDEILVSQSREPSARMMPTPWDTALAGIDLVTAVMSPLLDYQSLLLRLWFQALLDASWLPNVSLVEYPQLPAAVVPLVELGWGLELSTDEKAAMAAAAGGNAKRPDRPFIRDEEEKRSAAGEAIARAIGPVLPLYERLRDRVRA